MAAKSVSINISNRVGYSPRPSSVPNTYYPVFCSCGDAVPRIIAGVNWDGSTIIYYPDR